jgi:hypothetical protein
MRGPSIQKLTSSFVFAIHVSVQPDVVKTLPAEREFPQ